MDKIKLTQEQLDILLPIYRKMVKSMNVKWSKMPKRRSSKEIYERLVEQNRQRLVD